MEVLDQHGNRVFEYDDAHSALIPLVVVSISPWNDPRCPLFCAAIDPSPSTIVSSTFRTRGVVTFSNVVMTLPAHTPVSTKVYRSSVQTVRLIAESKCMVCLSAWSLPSTWTEFAGNALCVPCIVSLFSGTSSMADGVD